VSIKASSSSTSTHLKPWSPTLEALQKLENGDVTHLAIPTMQLPSTQAQVKRSIDVVGACALLVLSSPLWIIAALLIKATSHGPVIFKQTRMGLGGKLFTLYKFRSMVLDAEKVIHLLNEKNEASGPVFKIKNDPRLTRVGKFLRKWSIDELPQLINVLKGEMSLVGPRPPLPNEVAQYKPAYLERLAMQPGLTCIWQVSGRSHIPFEQWMELDREYIENWSLGLDLKILAQTLPAVLMGDGAQ
jgi:exopolysaccharide biosynthesis polyprenyl glycosylphosphotransferase